MKPFNSFVISLIPDIIVAYVIMSFLYEESFWVFIFIYIALQILYLFRWIVKSLVGWLSFKFQLKENLTKTIYKTLKEVKFPNPSDYDYDPSSPEHYYKDLLVDDGLEHDILLISQAYVTEFYTLRSMGLFQGLFRLSKVHKEAINKYQSYINKKSK